MNILKLSSNWVLYTALPYTTTETACKMLAAFPNNLGTDTISLCIYDKQMLQYVDDCLGPACVCIHLSTA